MAFLALLLALTISAFAQAPVKKVPAKAIIARNESIWSGGSVNATPDMVRFHDRWFVALREDEGVRVISSVNAENWQSFAKLDYAAATALTEPRISVTPDNRLMLTTTAIMLPGVDSKVKTLVRFSREGRMWTPSEILGDPEFGVSAIGWNLGKGLVISHSTDQMRTYLTTDGLNTQTLSPAVPSPGNPRDTAFVYMPDQSIVGLTRHEGAPAMLATSVTPYRGWRWRSAGLRIAGAPNLIRVPDGRIVAAVKIDSRTALCWLDLVTGELTEFLALPSTGELGHAGLAWSDDLLFVTYGSSHEGKQSIYLARIKLPTL